MNECHMHQHDILFFKEKGKTKIFVVQFTICFQYQKARVEEHLSGVKRHTSIKLKLFH